MRAEKLQETFIKSTHQSRIYTMLRRIFNIRRGEETRASFMLLYIFLIIMSLMIVKPVSTSLFLSQLGVSRLPYVFILVSVCAVVLSSLYLRLLKTVPFQLFISDTLLIVIASLVMFWTLFYFKYHAAWVLYAFYVWVGIFAVILVSQFWVFANLLFNPREAKRLFGFIGSGAIGGGILGGYTTNIFAPIIGSEQLLFICMVLLLACIPITHVLWKESVQQNPESTTEKKAGLTDVDKPLQLLKTSKHLLLTTAIVGVGVIAARLVEFQYTAIASSEIIDEDQLTAFFGFWLSNINIASFIIQLFITRHVVGVFGVGTSLFFLPAGILLGSFAILIHPALWTVIMLKISDGSLKNSINKAGIELLELPIPVEIKNQAKSFIDIFGDSFAGGLGGIVLVVMTNVMKLSVSQLSLVTVLFVGFWMFLIFKVKQEYIQAFRLKIIRTTKKQSREELDLKNESIFGGLMRILDGEDEQAILDVLRMVKEIKSDRLLPYFKKLLSHPSTGIRLEVLRNLYFYDHADLTSHVKKLVHATNQEIKTEAIHYLFQHAGASRTALLKRYLKHKDYYIRIAALLCAARESKTNREYLHIFKIKESIDSLFSSLKNMHDEELKHFTMINYAKAVGAVDLRELHPYLYILLRDPSKEVRSATVISIGQTRNREFIPLLLRALRQDELEGAAIEALRNYGPEGIEILVHFMNNPVEDWSIRLRMPRIIASIGTQKSANVLVQNMGHQNPSIRHEIIKSLNRLRILSPTLKFDEHSIVRRIMEEADNYTKMLTVLYIEATAKPVKPVKDDSDPDHYGSIRKTRAILIDKLENRLDKNLERIFRLLGLKYPLDDIYNIYLGVRSKKLDVRLNAIEFLDTVLPVNLKKVVIPLIETSMAESIIELSLEHFNLKFRSESECLIMLLSEDDTDLVLSTLMLIRELNDAKYISHVYGFLNHSSLKLRGAAEETLKKIGVM